MRLESNRFFKQGATVAGCLALGLSGWLWAQDVPQDLELQQNGEAADLVAPGDAPLEIYVVQPGDTLWDLCARFFRNPWLWPKIWSYNPHLSNPHWLFPGDKVRFGAAAPGTPVIAGTVEEPPAPEEKAPPQTVQSILRQLPKGYIYAQRTAFIDREKYAGLGEIAYSKEDKKLLSTWDEVYVRFEKEDKKKGDKDAFAQEYSPRVGDKMLIYRAKSKVSHPKTGKSLGLVIEVQGVLRVTKAPEKGLATAVIDKAFVPVLRGDRVGPLRDQERRRVVPKQAQAPLDGTIVETATDQGLKITGESYTVYLDRGKDDGVDVGHVFDVLRRGDGVVEVPKKDLKLLPDEAYGQIVVIDVSARTSTGIVTQSLKELHIGDRVAIRYARAP